MDTDDETKSNDRSTSRATVRSASPYSRASSVDSNNGREQKTEISPYKELNKLLDEEYLIPDPAKLSSTQISLEFMPSPAQTSF